jgi:DNA-directed RNA polymerase subunit RPC12/RpoP
MDRQAGDSRKITFRCPGCGAKLAVSEALAGKRGRCPKCRHIVAVPAVQTSDTAPEPRDNPDAAPDGLALCDLRLLDIAPDKSPPSSTPDSQGQEAAYQELQMRQGGRLPGTDHEVPSRSRRLPWIIDIFLYPANRAGLSALLICVGVPFIVRLTTRFFFFAMASFGPLFIFWVLFIVLHWAVLAMAMLYANWYFCECIRDSADGGVRAPETTGTTPGLGDIFGQAIKVVASVFICVAPALIYRKYTGSEDAVFQALYGTGGFFIPMAVLAMVMFDALHGLNPVLLLASILKTFLQYCVLAAFCYVSCLLVPMTKQYITTPETWMLGSALLFLTLYQLLILAHLLGRFYWRNEVKLNWDA